jgi:hypothetical protein
MKRIKLDFKKKKIKYGGKKIIHLKEMGPKYN